MTASRSPLLTCWPSLKLIWASWPSTRLFTLTVLEAVTLPSPLRNTGTSRRSAVATATGTTIWVEARAVLGLDPALHPSMGGSYPTAKVKVASKMLARRFADLPSAGAMPVAGLRRTFSIRIFTLLLPRRRSLLFAAQQTAKHLTLKIISRLRLIFRLYKTLHFVSRFQLRP